MTWNSFKDGNVTAVLTLTKLKINLAKFAWVLNKKIPKLGSSPTKTLSTNLKLSLRKKKKKLTLNQAKNYWQTSSMKLCTQFSKNKSKLKKKKNKKFQPRKLRWDVKNSAFWTKKLKNWCSKRTNLTKNALFSSKLKNNRRKSLIKKPQSPLLKKTRKKFPFSKELKDISKD